MSITTPIPISSAVAISRRTWRINFETPKGLVPVVSVFREAVPVDAAGNTAGENIQSMSPLVFTASAANIAALPTQFQGIPLLMSQFSDYLETQANEPAVAPTQEPS